MIKRVLYVVLAIMFSSLLHAQSLAIDWAKQFSGPFHERVFSIATDAQSNVYTTGIFNGTADFDPGVNVFNLTRTGGDVDIFISKVNSSGELVWAKQLTANSTSAFSDEACSIGVDANSNVYVCGSFFGTADFDPGPGVANLTSSNYWYDAFLVKLDAAGNFVWAKKWGGNGSDVAPALAIDKSNNIYVTGNFASTVDFDPNSGVTSATASGTSMDAYVSKFTSAGDFVWVKTLTGSGNNMGVSVAVDASNNVIVAGTYNGTVTGLASATSAGGTDIFVSKINSAGTVQWGKSLGGSSADVVTSVAADATGNVIATGNFQGTSDFDPGAGVENLTSAGSSDIFITKLDNTGKFVWAKSIGGTGSDAAVTLSTDAQKNVYSAGTYTGTVDFDPSTATTFNLASSGNFLSVLDSTGKYVNAYKVGNNSSIATTGICLTASSQVYIGGYYYANVSFGAASNLTLSGNSDAFIAKYKTSGTLPLHLLSFAGKSVNGQSQLQWQTTNEVSTASFVVEASTDGRVFTPLGTVKAAQNSAAQAYSFADSKPAAGNNYYRLKMIDADGTLTYSSVVMVAFASKLPMVRIYPVPAKSQVNIEVASAEQKPMQYSIVNTAGLIVQAGTLKSKTEKINISRLAKGVYHIQLENGQSGTIVKE